jgi:hypothetical protein
MGVITDPDPPPVPRHNPSASACEPYRDLIEQAVRLGRNATVIWQDLVDDYGFDASDQSVRRFIAKLRGVRVPEAHPVIETAPGEEGQVDYAGKGPMLRDPAGDLLEIVMRRYERASKILGDNAAVMLDRLLHHAHILKTGPRSWRTRENVPLRAKDAAR